jgi:hypothetical protein
VSAAAMFTLLSYRAAFILIAIIVIASMSLILIVMLVNPGLYPVWAFVALTILLVASTAFAGWAWLHLEGHEDTARK